MLVRQEAQVKKHPSDKKMYKVCINIRATPCAKCFVVSDALFLDAASGSLPNTSNNTPAMSYIQIMNAYETAYKRLSA